MYNFNLPVRGLHYVQLMVAPKFAIIPEGSPQGYVRASVAGTEAAGKSVIDAQNPATRQVIAARRTDVTYNESDICPFGGNDMHVWHHHLSS